MPKRYPAFFVFTALCFWLGGCSDAVAPTITDVDVARAAWLESSPNNYTFEFSTLSSWFPRSGYYRVEVRDRIVLSARDPDGQPTELDFTLDQLWQYLLAARAANQLNNAQFSRRGVPLDVDFGEWASDGGVRYWIRNFTAQ